jgi:mono/diheme cytochrome c family protein
MTTPISRALALAMTALCAATGQAQERAPDAIYRATCAYCHGYVVAPGVTVAPELLGRQLAPAVVGSFVRTGPGRMPAFRPSEVSDSELDRLARWIQASAAPAAPVAPGARP